MGSATAGVGIASTSVVGGGSVKIKNYDDITRIIPLQLTSTMQQKLLVLGLTV